MDHMHESHTMGSPSSPGYLPQYLLGGNSPAASPLSRGRPVGSSLGSYKGSPGQSGSLSSSRNYSHQFSSPALRTQGLVTKTDRTPARSSSLGCPPKDSMSAPPVEGLYDARGSEFINSPFLREQPMDVTMASAVNTTVRKSAGYSTPGSNITMPGIDSQPFSPQRGSSFPSPTQIDPFYTQGPALSSDDVLDECWVTVFGFPPAASSFILQQFSQYGNIIKCVQNSKGNWMHLQFQSKLQAKKALSKNGKVYGSDIMVGVVPCIEKSVMDVYGKENILSTPDRTAETSMRSSASNKPAPMRPLTAAYQAARSDHQVVPDGSRTPQKDSNFVSKAMEYMFGW